MKVGIIGSRRRNSGEDIHKVTAAFFKLKSETSEEITIISGGASRGGDRFAEIIAALNNIPIKIYYAEWEKYEDPEGIKTNPAGFIRNTNIAQDSDVLIACVAPDRTGGAEDTIKKFKKLHPNGRIILV